MQSKCPLRGADQHSEQMPSADTCTSQVCPQCIPALRASSSGAPCSFTSLRKDVDWGERADDWMCQSKVAIDLAEREFVPASAVAAAGACKDRFGGSYAVLTQVLPAMLPSGPSACSSPCLCFVTTQTVPDVHPQ